MPAERTKVVYLGSPLDEFARDRTPDEIAAARASLGIARDTIAVGTVTRLMPSKGNEYLVEAAASFTAKYGRPRVHRRRGRTAGEPLAQAKALTLGDRLVFAGFQRDVADVLAAFDIVVFPSLWEGTPLTAFEALASGKPIVATDADGLLDILTDRHDALVVPKRDAPALAGAVGELIEHPSLATQLAAECAPHRRALRYRGVRPQDGTVVRATACDLARDETRRHPAGRPRLSDGARMTRTVPARSGSPGCAARLGARGDTRSRLASRHGINARARRRAPDMGVDG